jgi:TetR/AcrR family transcriptional regulator, ethionamide resistance regulator
LGTPFDRTRRTSCFLIISPLGGSRTDIERLVGAVASRISRDVKAGLSPSDLDPEETALALVLMTERCLLDAFGRPESRPSREESAAVFATLEGIWVRTLYG